MLRLLGRERIESVLFSLTLCFVRTWYLWAFSSNVVNNYLSVKSSEWERQIRDRLMDWQTDEQAMCSHTAHLFPWEVRSMSDAKLQNMCWWVGFSNVPKTQCCKFRYALHLNYNKRRIRYLSNFCCITSVVLISLAVFKMVNNSFGTHLRVYNSMKLT